jgi:threonine dehydratase
MNAAGTAPAAEHIVAAARRIAGVAVVTPLLSSPALDAAAGARVLVKAESLQRTGSFKIRGAYNRLASIAPEERGRGVVAASSGNHAQGVAEAARLLGLKATIVMPSDAPRSKVAGALERGAAVVFYDRAREDRAAVAAALREASGAHDAPPFDHADTIAGQGTVGLEICAQARALGTGLDVVLCPASGGGLVAGLALALERESPATRIYAVEPLGFDDHRSSLRSGRRERNTQKSGSLCDALLAEQPGEITFAINRRLLAGALAVTDAEALAAVGFAFRRMKLVLEPGGAVALAAALLGKIDLRGKTVGVIASGGNVDPAVFARAIGGADAR